MISNIPKQKSPGVHIDSGLSLVCSLWGFLEVKTNTIQRRLKVVHCFNAVARDVPGGKRILIIKINAQHNALSKAI